MDELLSVLVVIGIIIKFAKKSNKTDKKNNGRKKEPAQTVTSVENMAEEVIEEAVRKAKEYRARTAKPAAPVVEPARPVVEPARPGAVPGADIRWLLEERSDCGGAGSAHGHSEGTSHADDTGCIGGSIAHGRHEGERAQSAYQARPGLSNGGADRGETGFARQEGADRRASGSGRREDRVRAKAGGPGNIAAKAQPDGQRIQGPTERARLSAAELRRAMITSEILREPVALRGRTARR